MKWVKVEDVDLSGYKGSDVALYCIYPGQKVTGKAANYPFVLVSGLESAFDTMRPETFIFAAHNDGKVKSWRELPGSFRGGIDHEKALNGFIEWLEEGD